LADALGPAALRFFRPMRVVGRGGGSYLGFSFCRWPRLESVRRQNIEPSYLLVLLIFTISTLASSSEARWLISLGRLARLGSAGMGSYHRGSSGSKMLHPITQPGSQQSGWHRVSSMKVVLVVKLEDGVCNGIRLLRSQASAKRQNRRQERAWVT
jgi:hypothetical protein